MDLKFEQVLLLFLFVFATSQAFEPCTSPIESSGVLVPNTSGECMECPKVNHVHLYHCHANEYFKYWLRFKPQSFLHIMKLHTSQWSLVTFPIVLRSQSVPHLFIDRSIMLEDVHLSLFLKMINVTDVRFITISNLWLISDLKQHVFHDMSTVSEITFEDCDLLRLNGSISSGMPGLSSFKVINSLFDIPDESLKGLSNLKTLHLTGENMNNLTSSMLSDLAQLTEILLERNKLRSIPEDLFQHNNLLQNITIKSNIRELDVIPAQIFKDLVKLKYLTLSDNGIINLTDGIFDANVELLSLDLSGNKISQLPEEIFKNLYKLKSLSLGRNRLVHIGLHVLEKLENLEYVDFSGNHINFDGNQLVSPFQCNPKLKFIRLEYNNITRFVPALLQGYTDIRGINLTFNDITALNITDVVLHELTETKVDLRHNNISQVFYDVEEREQTKYYTLKTSFLLDDNPILCDCHLFGVVTYMYQHSLPNNGNDGNIDFGNARCKEPRDMSELYVGNFTSAQFFKICRDRERECLQGCHSCWRKPSNGAFVIDCANQSLRHTPGLTSWKSISSSEYDLSYNNLNEMPPSGTTRILNITVLRLSHNNIFAVNVDDIPEHLEILTLDNNKITTLNSEVLKKFENIPWKSITLHNNPFSCECGVIKFVLNYYEKFPSLRKTTCEDQEGKKFMVDLSRWTYCKLSELL